MTNMNPVKYKIKHSAVFVRKGHGLDQLPTPLIIRIISFHHSHHHFSPSSSSSSSSLSSSSSSFFTVIFIIVSVKLFHFFQIIPQEKVSQCGRSSFFSMTSILVGQCPMDRRADRILVIVGFCISVIRGEIIRWGLRTRPSNGFRCPSAFGWPTILCLQSHRHTQRHR